MWQGGMSLGHDEGCLHSTRGGKKKKKSLGVRGGRGVKEEVGRTCQATEANSTAGCKAIGKISSLDNSLLCSLIHIPQDLNLKFLCLLQDLAGTCKTHQNLLLQLLQRPVRRLHQISHTLKILVMMVHFFQTERQMQLLGTPKDQRLQSISVLLPTRRE